MDHQYFPCSSNGRAAAGGHGMGQLLPCFKLHVTIWRIQRLGPGPRERDRIDSRVSSDEKRVVQYRSSNNKSVRDALTFVFADLLRPDWVGLIPVIKTHVLSGPVTYWG